MDFGDVLDNIATIATTAGATLTPPMTDVAVGIPIPRGRCVRIAWTGEEDPWDGVGDGLNVKRIGDVILVRGFWPIASADEAASRGRIVEMWTLASAFGTGFRGDLDLGGEVQAAMVDYAEADDTNIGGTLYAVLDMVVHVSYREQQETR